MYRATLLEKMINTWCEFPMPSCGWCGKSWDERDLTPCCEKPYIATNKEILHQFIKQIQEDKQTRINAYASNKNKSMRYLITMPPGLFVFLERRMMLNYGEKLFTKKYPDTWFAKCFRKWFCVPEIV